MHGCRWSFREILIIKLLVLCLLSPVPTCNDLIFVLLWLLHYRMTTLNSLGGRHQYGPLWSLCPCYIPIFHPLMLNFDGLPFLPLYETQHEGSKYLLLIYILSCGAQSSSNLLLFYKVLTLLCLESSQSRALQTRRGETRPLPSRQTPRGTTESTSTSWRDTRPCSCDLHQPPCQPHNYQCQLWTGIKLNEKSNFTKTKLFWLLPSL